MANTSTSRFNKVNHSQQRDIIRSVIACCDNVFLTVSKTLARATLTRTDRPRHHTLSLITQTYYTVPSNTHYI
jgi:hypothetical protein